MIVIIIWLNKKLLFTSLRIRCIVNYYQTPEWTISRLICICIDFLLGTCNALTIHKIKAIIAIWMKHKILSGKIYFIKSLIKQ